MGFAFRLRDANIVAYLTRPPGTTPPRVGYWEMRSFLGGLQAQWEHAAFFSANANWISDTMNAARDAESRLTKVQERSSHEPGLQRSQYLTAEDVRDVLAGLASQLNHYELFMLVVPTNNARDEAMAFGKHAALSSRHHALVLLPHTIPEPRELSLLDPLPGLRQVIEQSLLWPGVLFWTRDDTYAFAPLSKAFALYQDLLEGLNSGDPSVAERILRDFNASAERGGEKTLLHLSDLHYGTLHATQNEAFLKASLQPVLQSVDRVVVTGDLFDSPRHEHALAFRNFRADLNLASGKDIVVIPGNHDQKVFGNSFAGLGKKFRELADLEWSSLVVDEDMRCVFYCFDSSRDADLARGRVAKNQLMDVATLYATRLASEASLRDYLQVVLVHHHPYSFETAKETWVQRGFSYIGLSDEFFLQMQDADLLLNWCARRKIPLLLHGHKHVPRFVQDRIVVGNASHDLASIGCGSSLGAEGRALAYNVLRWSPANRTWTVTFYADPGDGSGFQEEFVSLHSAEA